MENKTNVWTIVKLVLVTIVLIIGVLLAGQTDHDEYIEAPSTTQTGLRYWRGN